MEDKSKKVFDDAPFEVFRNLSARIRAYLLARGPIIYMSETKFPGEILREWPDGRIQIIRRDAEGKAHGRP